MIPSQAKASNAPQNNSTTHRDCHVGGRSTPDQIQTCAATMPSRAATKWEIRIPGAYHA